AVVPSAAVTVYFTGAVKLFAVVPLVCTTVPTVTPDPLVVNVAVWAVTFVPLGMVTAIVLADSSTVPVDPATEKEVTAFPELGAALSFPPHPATNATSRTSRNHIFENVLHFSI